MKNGLKQADSYRAAIWPPYRGSALGGGGGQATTEMGTAISQEQITSSVDEEQNDARTGPLVSTPANAGAVTAAATPNRVMDGTNRPTSRAPFLRTSR